MTHILTSRYTVEDATEKASVLNKQYESKGYFFTVDKQIGYWIIKMYNAKSRYMGVWSDSLSRISQYENFY